MKKIIASLCISLLFGCMAQSQSFIKISNRISKCQFDNGIRKIGADRFNEVRLKLKSFDKLSFVESDNKVYFLETYDIESGSIYGMIWNAKGKLTYSYYQGEFLFDEGSRFSKYMINLINDWDIDAIKKEEELNGYSTPNPFIYATRVIKGDNKIVSVNCIKFKDFFKLGRD